MGGSAIQRRLYGGAIDTLSGAQVAIDYPHHVIHAGNSYFINRYERDLTATALLTMKLTTPTAGAGYVHFSNRVNATGLVMYRLIEGGTSSGGSVGSIVNHNLTSANTSGCVVTFAVTSITGTAIFNDVIGSGNGAVKIGGAHNHDDELILKADTSYLMEVESTANSTTVGMLASFYMG